MLNPKFKKGVAYCFIGIVNKFEKEALKTIPTYRTVGGFCTTPRIEQEEAKSRARVSAFFLAIAKAKTENDNEKFSVGENDPSNHPFFKLMTEFTHEVNNDLLRL